MNLVVCRMGNNVTEKGNKKRYIKPFLTVEIYYFFFLTAKVHKHISILIQGDPNNVRNDILVLKMLWYIVRSQQGVK